MERPGCPYIVSKIPFLELIRHTADTVGSINKAVQVQLHRSARISSGFIRGANRFYVRAMVPSSRPRQTLLLTLTAVIVGLTAAGHFRGGTISWKPLDPVHFTGKVSAIRFTCQSHHACESQNRRMSSIPA